MRGKLGQGVDALKMGAAGTFLRTSTETCNKYNLYFVLLFHSFSPIFRVLVFDFGMIQQLSFVKIITTYHHVLKGLNENHPFVFKKSEFGKQHTFETGQIPF